MSVQTFDGWQVRCAPDKNGRLRYYKRRDIQGESAWERTIAIDFRIMRDQGAVEVTP